MKPMIRIILGGAALVISTGAAAADALPVNVTVTRNKTVEKVDWSFQTEQTVEFSRLKRCIATNIHNDEVALRDSSGSWVGPATGNYYRNDNQSTIQAGELFKIIDDNAQFLVAQGQTSKTTGLSGWIIRFDLEAAVEQRRVVLVMRNVKLAASNTGSLTNDGFQPLGTWFRFKSNFAALEGVATAVRTCLLS